MTPHISLFYKKGKKKAKGPFRTKFYNFVIFGRNAVKYTERQNFGRKILKSGMKCSFRFCRRIETKIFEFFLQNKKKSTTMI